MKGLDFSCLAKFLKQFGYYFKNLFTVSLHCIPCKNGATCEQTGISARCHCAEGFFGDGCGELSCQANFDLFL